MLQKVCHGYAAFEENGILRPFEYPLKKLGPQDVEITITHCGICHSDLHAIQNDWKITKFPVVPGHEIIGTIKSVGSEVRLKPGARVGVGPQVNCCGKCDDCKNGKKQLCQKLVAVYNGQDYDGNWTYGGFSDRLIVNHRFVHHIPESLPSEVAAPLLCAGITVFSPLKLWTKPKDRVGIIGIGGLGHLAIQFAKAMGLETVAISSSPDKESFCKELGADHFVNSNDKNSMNKLRRSLDFILCCIAGSDLSQSNYLTLLKSDGKLCLVGVPEGTMQIMPFQLITRRVSICGSQLGSPEEVVEMLELAAKHKIVAKIEVFPMSEVNTALKKVEKNQVRFRCVLKAKL